MPPAENIGLTSVFHPNLPSGIDLFRPQKIAATTAIGKLGGMYRKDAVRHITRDVGNRLSDLRRKSPWTDWRMALVATQSAHPEWFGHGETMESLEPLLREAGVDMSSPEKPHCFVGNVQPDA